MDAATKKNLEKRIALAGGKAAAAKKIRCSLTHIYDLLTGERDASIKLAKRIEQHLGVPAIKILGL